MNEQAHLMYDGIAPIHKGAKIKALVDNPTRPTKAYQIKDLQNNIEYTSIKPRVSLGIPADFIEGSVISTTVYAEGKTLITMAIEKE